jgi:acylaminoacyl-peptidase
MTSELGINFDFNELQTTCWADSSEVWKHSPLKYANQAKTPILFLHGIEDHNCPLDQGLQMFGAMKYFNVPSRMVTFEGEWHTLLSAGSPEHKMVFLNEMISWFDQWLKASAE